MKFKTIKIYLVFLLIMMSVKTLYAQKDEYVQEQLNSMAIDDSLHLADPLDTYLKIAAENNPLLQSIFNQYLAAMERLPQAKALPILLPATK